MPIFLFRINGSSIKGVARSAALEELKNTASGAYEKLSTFVRVFGVAESDWKGDLAQFVSRREPLGLALDQKGAVAFLQATPTNTAKIVVDITNVHTPDYYRTGQVGDLSKEHPQPNYFPAVERGTEFAFPILLNGMSADTALLAAAERWLLSALTQRGLGAKTAAGYGWFADTGAEHRAAEAEAKHIAEAKAAAERTAQEAVAAAAAAFAALSPEEKISAIKGNLAKLDDPAFAEKCKTIAMLSEEEQRAIIRLFTDDKVKRDRLKTWRKKKPENVKILEDAAARLGEKLP